MYRILRYAAHDVNIMNMCYTHVPHPEFPVIAAMILYIRNSCEALK